MLFLYANCIADLRYFERRLTEVIQSMQPAATRWRCKLFYVFLSGKKHPQMHLFLLTFHSNVFYTFLILLRVIQVEDHPECDVLVTGCRMLLFVDLLRETSNHSI